MPYVSPYRHNTLALNTETLPENADIDRAAKTVTPTRGAIVRAHYETHVGSRVLMTLKRADGRPIPFGATASQAHEDGEFIVGDGGQVYLTGMHETGTVNVSWGKPPTAIARQLITCPPKPTALFLTLRRSVYDPSRGKMNM